MEKPHSHSAFPVLCRFQKIASCQNPSLMQPLKNPGCSKFFIKKKICLIFTFELCSKPHPECWISLRSSILLSLPSHLWFHIRPEVLKDTRHYIISLTLVCIPNSSTSSTVTHTWTILITKALYPEKSHGGKQPNAHYGMDTKTQGKPQPYNNKRNIL